MVAFSTSFLQCSLFTFLTATQKNLLACAATSGEFLAHLNSWYLILHFSFHHGAVLPRVLVGFRPTALTASLITPTRPVTYYSISITLLIGPGFIHALIYWENFSRTCSRTRGSGVVPDVSNIFITKVDPTMVL